MLRLEYSQVVRRKLKRLKTELTRKYGKDTSDKIMSKMVSGVKRLEIFPQSGTAVSLQYGLECDYSYVFVEHNYFFYRMKDRNTILILEMFNEREDFMKQLFGICTTSQETLDYWKE